jgi:phosphoglycerate dehydrogenase-like enzyme
MGMTVIGISSAPRAAPGFDRMVARDDLARAAADVDFLVALTPLTDETRGIVGEAVFRAMRPGSFLVNLARGGVVDEASLAAALMERRIAGAALDVFQTEPLPQGHPFWDMANVIVTPHLGGYCDDYVTLAMPAFERNLRAFLAGRKQDMINLIERK